MRQAHENMGVSIVPLARHMLLESPANQYDLPADMVYVQMFLIFVTRQPPKKGWWVTNPTIQKALQSFIITEKPIAYLNTEIRFQPKKDRLTHSITKQNIVFTNADAKNKLGEKLSQQIVYRTINKHLRKSIQEINKRHHESTQMKHAPKPEQTGKRDITHLLISNQHQPLKSKWGFIPLPPRTMVTIRRGIRAITGKPRKGRRRN
ncbi:MAG: hypothetical protein FJY86_02385 [Candidatus Diapherotrites archaeon]|uniref:Uncharacterized protein n=1 Tax=Candidatus Iainarchaeum sp. TaxID=3101447 RepID=A0A8T4CAK3_9ARCH|nr:hypothetical protein [Candidatus Diapherotrites archaeon]